jgi:hypothetical protein
MLWGVIGVPLGAPFLFWSEHGLVQFIAGAAVVLLLGHLCFLGYLLDCDADWMKVDSNPRSLWWYLKVTWGPLLVLGMLPRLLMRVEGVNSFSSVFNEPRENRNYLLFLTRHLPFFLGMVAGVVMGLLAVYGFGKLQSRFVLVWLLRIPSLRARLPASLAKQIGDWNTVLVPRSHREHVPENVQRLALAGTFFTLMLAAYLILAFMAFRFAHSTPALSLCILLGLAADVYAGISFQFPRAVYPALLILVLAVLLVNLHSDKHRLPNLNYDNPQQLNDYENLPTQGLDNAEVLTRWKSLHPGRGDAKPGLVVVAASGGGIRSAVWTATVLENLEQVSPGFSYHIRLITGASGGMLGAAYFVAKLDALHEWDKANDFRLPGRGAEPSRDLVDRRRALLDSLNLVENLSQPGLGPVAQYWALRDVPHFIWPAPYLEDRGWALEQAWSENLQGALDVPVRSLARGEYEGWRPSLVFAPMLVEDGRRVLISNLNLEPIARVSGRMYATSGKLQEHLYSRSAVEFFRLFPDADQFLLSTAVRMNASFPYISPAAALPTKPSRRIVDAGYYDNYGVDIAADWIYVHREWIQKETSGVLLIQIRDGISQDAREQVGTEDIQDRPWWQRGIQELSTPPEGAYSALMSSMSFRNDEHISGLSDTFNNAGLGPDRFTTVVIECPVQAELNWSLTSSEVEHIRAGVATALSEQLRKALAQRHPRNQDLPEKNQAKIQAITKAISP